MKNIVKKLNPLDEEKQYCGSGTINISRALYMASWDANSKKKEEKECWSNDKIPNDWVKTGQIGKHLASGYNEQIGQREVYMLWPWDKYFLLQPSHTVNKKISRFLFRAYLSFDPVK